LLKFEFWYLKYKIWPIHLIYIDQMNGPNFICPITVHYKNKEQSANKMLLFCFNLVSNGYNGKKKFLHYCILLVFWSKMSSVYLKTKVNCQQLGLVWAEGKMVKMIFGSYQKTKRQLIELQEDHIPLTIIDDSNLLFLQ